MTAYGGTLVLDEGKVESSIAISKSLFLVTIIRIISVIILRTNARMFVPCRGVGIIFKAIY